MRDPQLTIGTSYSLFPAERLKQFSRNHLMPARVHFATWVLLSVVSAAFLWVNLTESALLKVFDVGGLGDDWNWAARYLFTRGWPLSPWMVCGMHGMRYHPEEDCPWWALFADGVFAVVALFSAGVLSEWLLRCRDNRRSLPPSKRAEIHLPTKVILAVIVGVFLWANAVLSQSVERFQPPEQYSPAARYLFMRGWPLSPRMFSNRKADKLEAGGAYVWGTLVFDALLAFDALVSVAFLTEWCIRKKERGG